MGIFDAIYHHTDQRQVIDTIQPLLVNFSTEKTGRMSDTVSRSTEWVVRLRLEQNFWANKAQFDNSRKYAVNALARSLYEDVNRHIPLLQNAIFSGDKICALRIIGEIEKAMQP